MQIRSVGIDLGKTTFHLVALGDNGKVLLKKLSTEAADHMSPRTSRRRRSGWRHVLAAHFLGRALRAQGHDFCEADPRGSL